jgi:hypothetical protein
MLEHLLGCEIPTKHKEAMRQLYKFAKLVYSKLVRYYEIKLLLHRQNR